MDYEKAYEEALERAKGIYNENPSSSTAKFVCGQIFPEIKESEDERIRKALLKLVSNDKNNGYTDFYKAEGITCDDAIAYLEKLEEFQFGYPGVYFYDGEKLHFQGNPAMEEKRKEQKPVKCIDFDNEFENQVSHLIASVLNGEHEYSKGFVKYAVQSLLGYAQNELKSAEWSKEDEKMIRRVEAHLISFIYPNSLYDDDAKECIAWLESLRTQPHWKPSEEQMEALDEYIWAKEPNKNKEKYVISLYHDLKKL